MESDCYARNNSFIKRAHMLLSYTSKSTPEIGSTMKVIILFLLFEVAFGAPENGKSHPFTYCLIILTIAISI